MFNLFSICDYYKRRKFLKKFRSLNTLDIIFEEPNNTEDLVMYCKCLNNIYLRRLLKTKDNVKVKTSLKFLDNIDQLLNTTSTLVFFSGHNYIEHNTFYDDRIFNKLDWYGIRHDFDTLCIFNKNISVKNIYSLIELTEKMFKNQENIIPKIIIWIYISSLALSKSEVSHYNTAIANLRKLSSMRLTINNLKTYGKSNLFWDEF